MCLHRSPRRTWQFHCRRRRSGRALASIHPYHCTTVHLMCSCQMRLRGENNCEFGDINSEQICQNEREHVNNLSNKCSNLGLVNWLYCVLVTFSGVLATPAQVCTIFGPDFPSRLWSCNRALLQISIMFSNNYLSVSPCRPFKFWSSTRAILTRLGFK